MGGGSDDTFLYPLFSLQQKNRIFTVMTYTPFSFFVREINELEGNEEEEK